MVVYIIKTGASMNKKLLLLSVLSIVVFVTGCHKKDDKPVVKDTVKPVVPHTVTTATSGDGKEIVLSYLNGIKAKDAKMASLVMNYYDVLKACKKTVDSGPKQKNTTEAINACFESNEKVQAFRKMCQNHIDEGLLTPSSKYEIIESKNKGSEGVEHNVKISYPDKKGAFKTDKGVVVKEMVVPVLYNPKDGNVTAYFNKPEILSKY
jgi:hypothetical protein